MFLTLCYVAVLMVFSLIEVDPIYFEIQVACCFLVEGGNQSNILPPSLTLLYSFKTKSKF